MKIIFFGLGSIGQRHCRLLQKHFEHELFALRTHEGSAQSVEGVQEVSDESEIDEIKPDVAFITNPTFLHIPTALSCAERGMHLFIEKPLSHTEESVDELVQLCEKDKLSCYTAYCLRFHPVIEKMQSLLEGKQVYHFRVVCSSYLPQWRPNQNAKDNYSAKSSMGGGVVLDLSHEIDYVRYLFGKVQNVQSRSGRIADLTVDSEEYADILLEFESGVCGNLHLNFLSLHTERTIHVDFKDGYLTGDLINHSLKYVYKNASEDLLLEITDDELFLKQLNYFFDHLSNGQSMNNLKESKEILKTICEAKSG